MKSKNTQLLKIIYTVVLSVTLTFQYVNAQDSTSDNYMLIGASFSSGSDMSETPNQRIFGSIGGGLKDRRVDSLLYSLSIGAPSIWTANVPKISCFETISSGSSDCALPAINPDGMVAICGYGGCFDRARFEIDPQDNTSEVLYSIRVSTDPMWGSWKFVDGGTHTLEDIASHDINDYKTKDDWEQTVNGFNLLGLKPNTRYYIKATALKGDFTESIPSVENVSTTTGNPSIYFDIDIDDDLGFATETSGPYSVGFGVVSPGIVTNADNNIWIDLQSNSTNGVYSYVESENGGLSSSLANYTIVSNTIDLSSVNQGYGLIAISLSEDALGPLESVSPYNGSGQNVGELSTSPLLMLESTSAILGGRASLGIKLRTDLDTPAGNDYRDRLIFSVLGSF
jgi:hypothetical protein